MYSSSNIIYYQCIPWICSRNRSQITGITCGQVVPWNSWTPVLHLVKSVYVVTFLILSTIPVHKFSIKSVRIHKKFFSYFIKQTKLNNNRIECTVRNYYICSNCPWIYPVLIAISKLYFVLCDVVLGYPAQAVLLWFDYLYPTFIFMSLIFTAFSSFCVFSLFCFF